MKFSTILMALASYQVVVASPVGSAVTVPIPVSLPVTTDLEPYSISEADVSLATLEQRWSCTAVDTIIRTIGTSQSKAIYIASGAALAYNLCRYYNYRNCRNLSNIIKAGFELIFAAAADYAGAVPEPVRRRDGQAYQIDAAFHQAYLEYWKGALFNSSIAYETITSKSLNETEVAAMVKRDSDPTLLSRVHISGLIGTNNTETLDVVMHLFDDGTTVAHLPVPETMTGTSETVLTKRSRPGFKMSYTTRIRSLLTKSHQQLMSSDLADKWAWYAENTSMGEMIGLTKTGHMANFYYRIMTETVAFDTKYESVDVCGGMAKYL